MVIDIFECKNLAEIVSKAKQEFGEDIDLSKVTLDASWIRLSDSRELYYDYDNCGRSCGIDNQQLIINQSMNNEQ